MKKLVVVTLVLTSSAMVRAHQDPLGDVYPNVKVENGNFAIYFTNNTRETETRRAPLLRVVYSPEGKLLAPRHETGVIPSLDDELGTAAKQEFHLRDETLGFEGDIHEGRPSYVLTKNGKKEFHRLSWPEKFSGTFEAMWADSDSICVATITNQTLFLNHFDRHRFAPPETVQVTEADALPFIWDFPVVSNLVRVGDRYCIAWPRYNKTADIFECVISTWKPGEKRTKEIILDQPADWNSHLSMAVIGTRLCLAYHCLPGGKYFPLSKIITVFPQLDTTNH
jgi:hypothetical protein